MTTLLGIIFSIAAAWIFLLNGSILLAVSRGAEGLEGDELASFRLQRAALISNHVGPLCMSPFLAILAVYFFRSESVSFSSLIGAGFFLFGAGALLQSLSGRSTKALTHQLAARDGVQPVSTFAARFFSFVFGAACLALAYWLML